MGALQRGDKIAAFRTAAENIPSPFQALARFPPGEDADFIPLRENPRTLAAVPPMGTPVATVIAWGGTGASERSLTWRSLRGGGLDTLGGITTPRCPLAQRRQGAPEQTSDGNFRRPPSALRVERQVRPKKPAGREVAPHAKSFGRHGSRAPLSHPFLPMARAARQRGREKPCHEATSDTERRRAGAFTSPLWGGRNSRPRISGGGNPSPQHPSFRRKPATTNLFPLAHFVGEVGPTHGLEKLSDFSD